MRILYFTQGYSPHDERFLTALAGSGHEILFLRLEPEMQIHLPEPVKEVTLPGLTVDLQKQSYTVIVRKLKVLLSQIKPDIVHAGPLQGPAWLAARTDFNPLVSMSWGWDLLASAESSRQIRWRTIYTLSKTTVLLADAQAVAQKARSLHFPPERLCVFPWGVDLQHFSPRKRATLRVKLGWQKEFVFLCNRSMEPQYGVDLVVKAFIQVAAQFPQMRLLLMGKGTQEAALRRLVEEAHLMQRVHFGGFASRDELPGIYRSADVFLSASHVDGSSVSLMEALACGKPALVSDIPSNREWVTPGQNGWLFQDGNVGDLAELMAEVCQHGIDPTLGKNARKLAEQKADWHVNFQALLGAYDLALKLGGLAE
jgi:glycosyltransferase involved in cell wall biosynthesis